MTKFDLTLKHRISLEKTLDIQVPALEWLPVSKEVYKSIHIIADEHIEVSVAQKDSKTLVFSWSNVSDSVSKEIKLQLRRSFIFPLSQINVGAEKKLLMLQQYYGDVYFMRTDPFKTLLLTILSQNKTGEMARKAFFNLARELKNFSPDSVLHLREDRLKEIIRIAGPYKTKYMIGSSERIVTCWGGDLKNVMELPTCKSFDALTKLPGVGQKTAGCILVFAGLRKDIVPIDTHLRRVTQRLKVVDVRGKNFTPSVLQQINDQLKDKIPDAGYAHLFFVMLGREFCSARNPLCKKCPLGETCSFKANR